VKPPVTQKTALKQAGMDAIYKWKFEPAQNGEDLKSKVTITFRLK
jgi:outer membrane biosynthesis protein TonB